MFDLFSTDTGWFLLIIGVAIGFAAIIFGGDWFVNSAIWLAEITKIPKMIIGATVVSIGTALPETIVSFLAAGDGQTGVAIGNSIGSMFCNTALILAIIMTASVAKNIDRKQFFPKMAMLLCVSVLIIAFSANGTMAVWQSVILFVLFFAFMGYNLWDAIRDNRKTAKLKLQTATSLTSGTSANTSSATALLPLQDTSASVKKKNPALMISLFIVGAALIAVGASFLIDSVSAIAGKIGISEQIISLTVVALGTSLPELVTALNSLKKANTEISMGNIIGANIINATLIVGGSGLIAGGLVLPQADFLSFFVTAVLLLTVLLIVTLPIMLKRRTYRWQGITMITIYFLYLVFIILNTLGIIV